VISRSWLFGLISSMAALIVSFGLYQVGSYVKKQYDRMKQMVKSKEKEIELLTDLWKIDESEIDWLEPVSRGKSISRSRKRYNKLH